MGKYLVVLTGEARKQLLLHKRSGNAASIKKIEAIFRELEEHPYTGIGQPEQLRHQLRGFWSRRINQKDRLIYRVHENIVTVEVISAMGHYSDK